MVINVKSTVRMTIPMDKREHLDNLTVELAELLVYAKKCNDHHTQRVIRCF